METPKSPKLDAAALEQMQRWRDDIVALGRAEPEFRGWVGEREARSTGYIDRVKLLDDLLDGPFRNMDLCVEKMQREHGDVAVLRFLERLRELHNESRSFRNLLARRAAAACDLAASQQYQAMQGEQYMHDLRAQAMNVKPMAETETPQGAEMSREERAVRETLRRQFDADQMWVNRQRHGRESAALSWIDDIEYPSGWRSPEWFQTRDLDDCIRAGKLMGKVRRRVEKFLENEQRQAKRLLAARGPDREPMIVDRGFLLPASRWRRWAGRAIRWAAWSAVILAALLHAVVGIVDLATWWRMDAALELLRSVEGR